MNNYDIIILVIIIIIISGAFIYYYNKLKIKEQIFMGHDGNSMDEGKEYYITKYFDWIFMNNKIIKKKTKPNTCYIKTDYLNKYLNDILSIKNKFILVSASSDYSPSINFKESYEKIIKHPLLLKWYAENNLSDHPKIYSLPTGFATHSLEYENIILNIRKNIKNKTDKIFVCFKPRNTNDCGEEYVERIKCDKFINNHLTQIDRYHDLNQNDFLKKLSQYKWCFCPLGNGVSHEPKILECLFLKTIPICKKNPHSYNLYSKYPVIWIDDFDTILTNLKYDFNYDWDKLINEFTHKYIFDYIINNT